MPEDIRKTEPRTDPRTGSGSGAAYRTGYGAGGQGSGAEEGDPAARSWDAPGVTPDGARTGSASDGRRMPMDDEAEPDPERPDLETPSE